eukprot:Pgem_evm1s19433
MFSKVSVTSSEKKIETNEDVPDESEPDVQFEKVLDVKKVSSKSGEEDEDVLLVLRAKLYRYDQATSGFKERGTGDMKFLKHPDTKKVRLVMRRNQLLKICANHYITGDMELKPMETTKFAWIWTVGADFADGEPTGEMLAIRLKTQEDSDKFVALFNQSVKDAAHLKTTANTSDDTDKQQDEQSENRNITKDSGDDKDNDKDNDNNNNDDDDDDDDNDDNNDNSSDYSDTEGTDDYDDDDDDAEPYVNKAPVTTGTLNFSGNNTLCANCTTPMKPDWPKCKVCDLENPAYNGPPVSEEVPDEKTAPTSKFGITSGTPAKFGIPGNTAAKFGVPSGTPATFGVPSGTPATFGVPSGTPATFGVPSGASDEKATSVPSDTSTKFGIAPQALDEKATSVNFGVSNGTPVKFGISSEVVPDSSAPPNKSVTEPKFGITPNASVDPLKSSSTNGTTEQPNFAVGGIGFGATDTPKTTVNASTFSGNSSPAVATPPSTMFGSNGAKPLLSMGKPSEPTGTGTPETSSLESLGTTPANTKSSTPLGTMLFGGSDAPKTQTNGLFGTSSPSTPVAGGFGMSSGGFGGGWNKGSESSGTGFGSGYGGKGLEPTGPIKSLFGSTVTTPAEPKVFYYLSCVLAVYFLV